MWIVISKRMLQYSLNVSQYLLPASCRSEGNVIWTCSVGSGTIASAANIPPIFKKREIIVGPIFQLKKQKLNFYFGLFGTLVLAYPRARTTIVMCTCKRKTLENAFC